MRNYFTLQYTLFYLFQYSTPKWKPTVKYSTAYFHFLHVLYPKCVPTIPYTTPYFQIFKGYTQNAYLLLYTVHLICMFSSAVHKLCT